MIPNSMKQYGATETVDPIIKNNLWSWSEMVCHDEIDANAMLSDASFASDRGYSIAKIVTYRVHLQHSLHQSQKEHSVY